MKTHQFITLFAYPNAILHIDADAFFASVEQAVHPKYRGKPVVTGAERGIIAAASYEAKALGIKRGIHLREAKKICPALIVLPTDYETCSLFSQRMFDCMRQYTSLVEEYSIDEAFVDITGLRRVHRCSYEEIARKIKRDIENSLGITVSVGLSLTKSLAKICSDFRKPAGFTAVKGKYIHLLLQKIQLQDIWGIGHSTAALLKKYGVENAYDYAKLDPAFLKKLVNKTTVEIHQELNGQLVYPVNPQAKDDYKTITKFKTFSPATRDKEVVRAFLLRNLESACIKARRHQLAAKEIYFTLRTQDFEHLGMRIVLNRASANTLELSPVLSQVFNQLLARKMSNLEYRATGVVLAKLQSNQSFQMSIFDTALSIIKAERISASIDEINHKFGKHTLHLAASLAANHQHQTDRGRVATRKLVLLKGETKRQRLGYAMMLAKI